jgi:hypothetical protein
MKLPVILLLAFTALALCQEPSAGPSKSPDASALITQSVIEERLAELEKGRTQAAANLHAFDGAIQECQYWLNLVKAKAAEAKKQAASADAKKKPSQPAP